MPAIAAPHSPILVFMTGAKSSENPSITPRANIWEQEFVDILVPHRNAASNPSANGTEALYRITGPTEPPGVRQRSTDYATLLVTQISTTVEASHREAMPSRALPRSHLEVFDDHDRLVALIEFEQRSSKSGCGMKAIEARWSKLTRWLLSRAMSCGRDSAAKSQPMSPPAQGAGL